MLVVETTCRACVSGPDDLTRLDFEVRHRIGSRPVGEHQVAVHLEGVGAGGLPARISTSPIHTVCASGRRRRIPCSAPLYSTLDLQFGFAWSTRSLDSKVLAVVGEIQAEQFGVATGRIEANRARHPNDVAAQSHRDMAQNGVLAETGMLRTHMNGVVGPIGDPHHRQPRRTSPTTNSTLSAYVPLPV